MNNTDERNAALALDAEQFRALGHALVDRIAAGLAGIPEGPVAPEQTPEELRALLQADRALPREGRPPGELLTETAELLFDRSLFNGHPRFFGYITASPAPIGMLGDLLAAAINPNCGAWKLSPLATEIELQTLRWIAELLAYPSDSGGLMVSGGNMANLVGFLAARASRAGWELRAKGIADGQPRLCVYASAETHTWIQKAADITGLGTDAIRWIATDPQQRMDVDALAAAVEEDRRQGGQPLLVVGTAGSVSTGAVDPLRRIGEYCRDQGIWFHVDGAYGGFAAAVEDAPEDLKHLGLADSIAVDPHKWLYAPLEAGCALVRDAEALKAAFSYQPPYYHFGTETTNFFDLGPQNSRGFRALKVWLALQQAGADGYRRMIRDDMALARRLHRAIGDHEELESGSCELSITTFRYRPMPLRGRENEPEVGAYLNELNRSIQERLEREGRAFVSNAVLPDGRYLLRACIVNFNTRKCDVDQLPHIVVEAGRAAARDFPPAPADAC